MSPEAKPKSSVPPVTSAPSRRRLWIFRLIAISLPILALLAVEVMLRVAGTGYPAGFLVAAPGKPGILTDNYKFAWRFFPKALARTPQPIVVATKKPTNSLRVIVFGGSAAMGDPEPAYGLPRVLEALLRDRYPDLQVEVINAAVTAVNSHVVLSIVRDCRQLDADAWVVYLGNNEVHGPFGAGTVFGRKDTPFWLNRASLAMQRTKLGQWAAELRNSRAESESPKNWGGMEMFLQHQVRHDDPALDRVYANFRRNLRDILALAPRSTHVVVSTVVTNLKDSPPFVSLHREAIRTSELEPWKAAFEAGCQAQVLGNFESALSLFLQAAKIDAEFAELQFRIGQCHFQLGRHEEALEAFRLARDLDALRFRADSTINDIIRSVAGGTSQVCFVDAEQEIAEQIPTGIVGDDLLYEHVHLNFHGNYQLARLFAEALASSCGWDRSFLQGASPRWLSQAACRQQLGLTSYHELEIVREMRGRLNQPPFIDQVDHDQRDAKLASRIRDLSVAMTPTSRQEATASFEQLLTERPDDWVLREQFALLLESTGDLDAAIDQWQLITNQLPHHAESLFRLGALYNRAKQWSDAERVLRRTLQLRPDFARAANSLGICLSHQQRFEESYEQFKQAIRLQPTFAEAFYNWGLVLANQRDHVAAEERYREAILADKNYVPAHEKLGKIYVEAKNYTAALPYYSEVAKLRPHDVAAQLNLGLLFVRMQKRRAAEKQLRRTLEIDPGNRHALQALQQMESSNDAL